MTHIYSHLHLEAAIVQTSSLLPCGLATSVARKIPRLPDFIAYMVNLSQTLPMTLLAAMVFLERFRKNLPGKSSGAPETLHRVFLAALILANKVLFDVPLKNSHWAKLSASFYSLDEINLMEKQFLSIIHYDLSLHDEDVVLLLNHVLTRHRMMPTLQPQHPWHQRPTLHQVVPMPARFSGGSCGRSHSISVASTRPSFPMGAFAQTSPSSVETASHFKLESMSTMMIPSSLVDHSPFSDMVQL